MTKMIDLHLHLDGSLSIETVKQLAKEQKLVLPYPNEQVLAAALSAPKNCKSLNDYLRCFDLPLALLQTKESLDFAVSSLIKQLCDQGLIYAEIRFAPQFHTRNGLSQLEVVRAVVRGLEHEKARTGMNANLILCCMRGEDNKEENIETLTIAEKLLEQGVCAVDLAGAEAIYPTERYENLFRKAREMKLPFTVHAGEADGPKSIYTALSFGAKRIGHGVRCVEDERLVHEIAENRITLEMCPSSNLQTKAVNQIEDYPVGRLLELGVNVTVNTDNMTVSQTTITKEFALLKSGIALTAAQQKKLMLNAVAAAFTGEQAKREMSLKIEDRFYEV